VIICVQFIFHWPKLSNYFLGAEKNVANPTNRLFSHDIFLRQPEKVLSLPCMRISKLIANLPGQKLV